MKPSVAAFAVAAMAFVGLASCQTAGKTKPDQTVEGIKGLIRDTFAANPELLPAAVRLTFHDCIGPNGCDGCINLNNENNKGLEGIIDALTTIVQNSQVSPFLGMADLWSLAGIVAIEEGIKNNNEFCQDKDDKKNCPLMPNHNIDFKWGRVDCPTAPASTEELKFPTADMTRREMLMFFRRELRMGGGQVTALMGAHSLGKARLENTGYNGSWTVGRENHFNNEIFRNLLSKDLEFRNEPNSPDDEEDKDFQFNLHDKTGARVGMLLNTDVQLAYNIDVDSFCGTQCLIDNSGKPPKAPSCRVSSRSELSMPANFAVEDRQIAGRPCPAANTNGMTKRYAKSPRAFIRNFSRAYAKLMNRSVNKNLEAV